MSNELRRALLTEFSRHGWRVDENWLNSCSKDYKHAAGGTTAAVYLYPRDCGGVTLHADYVSEGCNVLSTVWYPIDLDASDAAIAEKVTACAGEIEGRISQTYAMRIMRNRLQAAEIDSMSVV